MPYKLISFRPTDYGAAVVIKNRDGVLLFDQARSEREMQTILRNSYNIPQEEIDAIRLAGAAGIFSRA